MIAAAADQAPTLVTKLKSSGVTSVVLFTNNALMAPLTKAATAQEYSPEWVFTGYSYQDFDAFARTYDQEQMKHAFGLSVLFPSISDLPDYLDVFNWYWGKTQGNNWGIASGLFNSAYTAIQYAGPTLTAREREEGFLLGARPRAAPPPGRWRSSPGTGRPWACRTTSTPCSVPTARFAYWNGDVTGPSQAVNIVGKGVFMYMDEGKRYNYKGFPKAEPKFFDPKGAVSEVSADAQFTGGVAPAASPCTGCPSNGGTG